MDETGSSVKQPRNMESEKGKVEAASSRKEITAFSTKMDKNTTNACSEDLGQDYTLGSLVPKKVSTI